LCLLNGNKLGIFDGKEAKTRFLESVARKIAAVQRGEILTFFKDTVDFLNRAVWIESAYAKYRENPNLRDLIEAQTRQSEALTDLL
jgi:hypothetical protein